MPATHVQERDERRVRVQRQRTSAAAHPAMRHGDRRDRVRTRREALHTANPDLAHPDMHRRITHILLASFYPCAYLFETCLAWATFEYYARMIGLGPTPTRLFCLAGPLAVIVIEILISLQRYEARDAILDGDSPGRYRWWTLAGLAAVTFMPAFALATQMTADSTLASTTAFRLKTYAITGLALLVHGCVVFSGSAAHDAKAFVLFTFQDSRLAVLIRYNDARWRHHGQISAQAFINYWHLLETFNRAYPGSTMAPGPFDQVTRDFLNIWFGYPIVGSPNGSAPTAGGNPPAGNGRAPVPSASSSPLVSPVGPVPRPPSPSSPAVPVPPVTPAPTPLPSTGGAQAAPAPPSLPEEAVTPPSSNPAPAGPAPANDGSGGTEGDGELEYLRQLLRERVRQADGEVVV